MTTSIYQAIINALLAITDQEQHPVIRHIDLWNQNVEFIDQETPWQRPAVFVEFMPCSWQHLKPAQGKVCAMRAAATLRLHIVTDWQPATAIDASLLPTPHESPISATPPSSPYAAVPPQPLISTRISLINQIRRAITSLTGDDFAALRLIESAYSHNHDEIIEDIETYQYTAWQQF